MSVVGVLGTRERAAVDGWGTVTLPQGEDEIAWWIGADDGWHVPGTDTTLRHRRPTAAPIFETAVHVPGGDVVHRVLAVAAASGQTVTIIEIENETRSPCSFAVVLRIRRSRETVRVDDCVARFGGSCDSVLSLSRRPRLWADGLDDALLAVVRGGGAHDDPEPAWRAPRDIALLTPGPPRTTLRIAHAAEPVDPLQLPSVDAVARGWERQLERGMRVELPEPWHARVDAARVDTLLAPPSATAVAALEDWGFDDEAAAAWHVIGLRARRAARRRRALDDPWRVLRDEQADAADTLVAMRQVLVGQADDVIEVAPHLPAEWLGLPVAVHDVPTRRGPVSFAVRWHGSRPALLWDAPRGTTVRAPALDPSWSSTTAVGETLLAEPPPTLLAMGTRHAGGATQGHSDAFGAPESFT
jgi:hypothetical protein